MLKVLKLIELTTRRTKSEVNCRIR